MGLLLPKPTCAASTWLTSTFSVQLMLGIADGKNFRFIVSKPQWQMGHDYVAKSVITPMGSQLFLDGQLLGSLTGAFKPLVFFAFFASFARNRFSFLSEHLTKPRRHLPLPLMLLTGDRSQPSLFWILDRPRLVGQFA